MKFSERLKIWFGVQSEKVLKVDDIEILKAKLKEAKEKYKQLNDKYLQLRGEEKTLENEIEGMKRTKERVMEDARRCKKENLENELGILFKTSQKIDSDMKLRQEKIENNKKLIEKYNTARVSMMDNINELEGKLNEYQAKEEFSKLTNEYMEVLEGTSIDCNIEQLKHDIDTKFNASDLKLEELQTKLNESPSEVVKTLREDEELKKFIDEL